MLIDKRTIRKTPSDLSRARMKHRSTNLVIPKDGPNLGRVIMLGTGNTYRRTKPKPKRPGRARRTWLAEGRL